MNNLYQDLLTAKTDKKTAITFMCNKMTKKDFVQNIDNMAGFLSSIGVKKGSKVGIVSPNVPTAVIAFYAINKIGAVSNIFHPLIATNDLIKKLKQTDTNVVFVYDLFYKKYKKALKNNGIKVIICSSKDYLDSFTRWIFSLYLNIVRGKITSEYDEKDFRKNYPSTTIYNEDACLLHSSGTDKEKTVILTNENFIELKNKMIDVVGKENLGQETALVSLPIFHCFGLAVGVHSCLSLGFDIVLMPTFNTKSMVRLVKKYGVTVLIVIPSMVRKFIKNGFAKNFKSVKHIYCGGDNLPTKLREQFDKELSKYNTIKLLEGYGLTELTGVCVVNTEKNYKEGSIGKPISGIQAVVLDEENKVQGFDKEGELALSSSTIMKSYYDGTTNTVEINGKTYFKTGDIVKMDSDGYLYYLARKKNIIKISGINVFPNDIEELVLTIPEVKEAVCIEKKIEGKPYIYLYAVVSEKSEELKGKIKDIVKNNMLKYCRLKEVVFVDSLKLTKNGKIDKKYLQNLE